MDRIIRRILGLFLAAALLAGAVPAAAAGNTDRLRQAVHAAAQHVLETVPSPDVGAIGGEWAVLGLARSGYAVPQTYWDGYCKRVERTVKNCRGVLHTHKYTEYARLVLALTAIGADPTRVAGYDLLAPLNDYDRVAAQGINGPIYALLALECGGRTQNTVRQRYIDHLLSKQRSDGGWSLSGPSDPDLTAMALQALAGEVGNGRVRAAVDKGLVCLSGMQRADGGFGTAESTAQVLVALCALGYGPDYAPMTKNRKTVLDGLLAFRDAAGGFRHDAGGTGSSRMATEQALYALAAALRHAEGRPSLYDMRDVTIRPFAGKPVGLAGLLQRLLGLL